MSMVHPDDTITIDIHAATPDGQSIKTSIAVPDEAEIAKLMKLLHKKGWAVLSVHRRDCLSYERALATIDKLQTYVGPQ